ncbi:MAG: hypothetical protein JJU34_14825 [Lunatimonas sp.]|uniref:hypothetical protein n=1 Tax=Lunatimonas sp. TaxID=2060141 RepID=UPI00263BAC7F|nr:hypothetical protein [Lunatimonas sp.]MCC5938551.1 hypothetical protein [Lunatimonas sp.]
MKIQFRQLGLYAAVVALICCVSCVETDELVTPNVASPVLVVLQGSAFAASAPVSVNGRFYELDKSGILDHTVGIDSIPVAGLQVRVFINHTQEIGSATTDSNGRLVFEQPWSSLGLSAPRVGNTVRLEFAGVHKDIAFRTYHNVSVR